MKAGSTDCCVELILLKLIEFRHWITSILHKLTACVSSNVEEVRWSRPFSGLGPSAIMISLQAIESHQPRSQGVLTSYPDHEAE